MEAIEAITTTEEEGYSFVEIFVYAVLGGMIVYLLKQIFMPPQHPRPVYVPKPKPVPRPFTKEELRQYDGAENRPIYIGVKGKIYDVSSRGEFYGPGGPYNCFAGRDASRALALGSLEEKDVENSSLEGLAAGELETLEEWIQSYEMKYDVVGFYPFDMIADSAGPAATDAAPTAEQSSEGGEKGVATEH